MTERPIHVIGGGLAGCEAAWAVARAGIPVVLHEMRPERRTEAHQTGDLAELVCSNSLRSDDAEASAVGLLHAEMRAAGSLIILLFAFYYMAFVVLLGAQFARVHATRRRPGAGP